MTDRKTTFGHTLTFSCACKYRQPKCDMRGCRFVAGYSVHLPWHSTFKFMCEWHYAAFHKAITGRIPGLDPHSQNTDEDWRPSIMEIARWGIMAAKEPLRLERKRFPLNPKFVARLEELTRRA